MEDPDRLPRVGPPLRVAARWPRKRSVLPPVTEFRPLSDDDLGAVSTLLAETEGVSVRGADSPEALKCYLERNPGLSVAAIDDDAVVGFVLCGHDGRRGYLHHLVVQPEHRGRGIAREMVSICMKALEGLGIYKTHVDVFVSNEEARAVWRRLGWTERNEISRFSYISAGGPDA